MLTRFYNYLRNIKGYSERTCSEYLKDLKGFCLWVKNNKPSARWSTLTRSDIDEYITYRAESGVQPSTTNRELSSISALYRYFQREGLLTVNPCKYMSRRKQAVKVPKTIPTEDLRTAYEHAFGITKVWLGLLTTTGIRISELLNLSWEDVDFTRCSLAIMGKGKKERIVYTLPECLEQMRQAYELHPRSGRIFHQDQREARFMIFSALRPYTRAKQLSPHAIRHSFATNLANNGVNVSTIASILGHNRIETTQKYIDMSQADTRQAVQRNSII